MTEATPATPAAEGSLDPLNPFAPRPVAKQGFDTLGTTGLVRFGGQVDEEWLQQLAGIQGVRVWREMKDNDSVIGNAFYLTQSLIRQTKWSTEPADDEDKGQTEKWAKFLTEAMGDMSHTWEEMLSEILSLMPFGWSYFEKIFKVRGGESDNPSRNSKFDDGLITWRKIPIRAQETLDSWEFDEDGGIRGLWQVAAPKFERVFIPIEKSILFRTEVAKNNPEGRSLLRNAYRAWFFLKRLQEIEAIGMERELVGIPIIRLPFAYLDTNASKAKKEARNNFATMLQQIRRNEHEGLLFPARVDGEGNNTGFDIELLSSGGSRQIDISAAIARYQRDIATVLLTQFSFLGMGSSGSFALSSDQTSMYATAIGAILDTIESTFDRFATQELYQLNGVPPQFRAKWKHGDIEKEDIQRFADMINKFVSSGVLAADETLERHVRDKVGLPPADDTSDEDDALLAMSLPRMRDEARDTAATVRDSAINETGEAAVMGQSNAAPSEQDNAAPSERGNAST